MTKETLEKMKKVWEDRKAKGDRQADEKLAKIEKTLNPSKDVNVIEELKKAKK